MTRETKIGLLVGLAFIIVIGILLSDHLTSSTEPPQAQLAQVGNNVRQTTVSPGATAPPITTVTPPQQVQPQQPVMTQQEASRPQPVQIIRVGPTPSEPQQSQARVAIQPPAQTQQPQQDQQPTQVAQDDNGTASQPPITRTPDIKGTLAEVADKIGEPLVGLHGETPATSNNKTSGKSVVVATTAGRQYKAEANDSVSSMARKFLGANTKPNRDAIIAANPSLQQNPDLIIAGKTYLIPNVDPNAQPQQQSAQPAPVVADKTTPASDNSASNSNATSTNTGDNFYVVKPGDNLSKIAVMQCGTAGAVTAIKELNKDLLKDSDVIQVGMKLRLPSKPLAAAE